MRGAVVSLWLSAIQVAVALFVGNLIAKRLAAILVHTAMVFRW
ncbi:hypothetical protein ATHL_00989 [Anaerolinea thermolimosa]|nr:hypothetical protein ATHL_00989 [Anaerolinea thermolimosa]